MDQLHLQFLNILRSALRGEQAQPVDPLPPEQLTGLLTLARTHNVLPMIYEAIFTWPSICSADPGLIASCRNQVFRQVIIQTAKTSELLSMIRHLDASGIRPLVVKGLICRQLYPDPDHRASGDEDVLIRPEQFAACHQALLEFGMQAAETPENIAASHEVPYGKPGSPLYIELHKHLFPPKSNAYGDFNRFFEGVFDRAVTEEIMGTPVRTMGYTDHFFYLICHAFKHFLHSGFGIRQVCDIILYANAYGDRIDWTQVFENCRAIHAEQFCAALFRIGEKYLVFDAQKACICSAWRSMEVDESPMLEDLLCGGLYGDANLSRKHSSTITLDAVAAQKQGKQARGRLIASLFPPRKNLEPRFPYLKRSPLLLPVAWIHRIILFGLESTRTRDSSAAEALKIGAQRVELMRLYGIIK